MSEQPMLDRPVLNNGRYFVCFDEINRIAMDEPDPMACAAAIRIFCALSYQHISYYSAPTSDPTLTHPDERMARVAMLALDEWMGVKERVSRYFKIDGGTWRLREDKYFVRWNRPSLSPSLRRQVFERDGDVCKYCGSEEGPFEVDHIHPVSKGGKDEMENLTVACKRCNRDKSDKLVGDWLE